MLAALAGRSGFRGSEPCDDQGLAGGKNMGDGRELGTHSDDGAHLERGRPGWLRGQTTRLCSCGCSAGGWWAQRIMRVVAGDHLISGGSESTG